MQRLFTSILTLTLFSAAALGQHVVAVAKGAGAGSAQAGDAGAGPTPPATLSCQVLTGRVTDPFAYPLTGATIMLRTPSQGFSLDAFGTNAEGHYIITSKKPIPSNTILEVSAVGYTTLQLPITDCRPLDITMTPVTAPQYKVKVKTKKGAAEGKLR